VLGKVAGIDLLQQFELLPLLLRRQTAIANMLNQLRWIGFGCVDKRTLKRIRSRG
jgi:hypothetical protein